MKIFAVVLFVVMVAAQWFIPGEMIWRSEAVISDGEMFKFKTRPIDPTDPFRGKYITLRFEADHVHTDSSLWGDEPTPVFVTFETNAEGFAQIKDVARTEPPTDTYLETTAVYLYDDQLEVELPFDRFYLEESKASEAERVYWETRTDSTQIAYAVVRIGKGKAVLTDVMINDKSIVDVVKEINENKNQ